MFSTFNSTFWHKIPDFNTKTFYCKILTFTKFLKIHRPLRSHGGHMKQCGGPTCLKFDICALGLLLKIYSKVGQSEDNLLDYPII